ncbi:MAG: glycosyltransferase [Bacteroidaceae bacterium]|nr:glycosyltransferase [Bacteroidaceae bacterium]
MDKRTDLPQFSILTVTYNAEAFIERTLKSVACQTYTHYDYHIIDGASTDRTLALCEAYPSVVTDVVSEPDEGLYDAMNKAIRRAKGDYLIFLNAGDQLDNEDTLLDVMHCIVDSGSRWPDVVYGETKIVDEYNRFVRWRRLAAPERLDWKSFRHGMLVCHQAFWASRELALREPYDLKYRYSADFDWCIRILRRADVILNTHQAVVAYLEGGMSIRHHRASLLERLRIMARHYGWPVALAVHLWFVVRAVVKR